MIRVFNISPHLYYGIIDLGVFAREQGLSAKREIETAGRDKLLRSLIKDSAEIWYDEKGKPHLKDSDLHISISHSHDRLAIIINTREATGIDIELVRDKVLRIRHKFLSGAELLDAGQDIEKLLVYWAAKESLYKIYGLKEVDFIRHLSISSFVYDHHGGYINGHIHLGDLNQSYLLHYQKTDDYILVYALEKK